MDFTQFMVQEGIFIAAGLYVLAELMKLLPDFKNWLIPFVLLPVGIVAAGFSIGWTVGGIAQGVFATGAAVLVNQMIKQGKDREN